MMKDTDTIPQLIHKYSVRIVITVLATALIALGVSLLLPKQYLSEASVLPANSRMMDKQTMFGNNIQELYSAYGASDDLDRLMASMHSSTVLQAVADSLQLATHYGIREPNARKKALKKLTRQLKMQRSEYSEIGLKVWDKDPAMALSIANAILANTQHLYDDMFRDYYQRSIARLDGELKQKVLSLGVVDSAALLRSSLFSDEEVIIRRKIAEYRITQMNPPAALFILAKPEQAVQPDKPDVLLNTILAAAVALICVIAWIACLSVWKNGYAKP